MYNRYAESGRIEWVQQYIRHIDPGHAQEWAEIMTPRGSGLILRKITTEFKFPMKYPDHVTVLHKLGTKPKPGMDAFIFDVVILSELHQRIAARVYEDCVYYDYRAGKKTSLKPFMVDVLSETWRLQEAVKQANSERVQGLLERVRKLEVESWDREGAMEDTGSAGQ
ncbi:uncharacterized protein LTR77_003034 [Saxophila tyrrhenica]|uniref:Uncharacterized protein n=1 Tax=Saxophila tyrrhenica TaxID=1690608 RepID=A0AAV9PJS6_9PEZI|nr:hypothetical protein LTR77_003034 [Saxophila tyrrhenica]